MTQVEHEKFPDTHNDSYSKTIFGFWVYLLTDFMMFAVLFASFAVLRHATFGGPGAKELFDLNYTLAQTLILLTSSFIIGLGGAAAHRRQKVLTICFYVIAFLLGVAFMWMEMSEFTRLIEAGHDLTKSAYLTAYFTLVGTHGIHMYFGLIWFIVLLIPVFKGGLHYISIKRLTCLKMFWQFLNVVWIFIFTLVYLMGVN